MHDPACWPSASLRPPRSRPGWTSPSPTTTKGVRLDAGKDLIGKRSFWTNHVAVLGRIDGDPTCCAAVLMVAGYRYVALVATAPGHQRRGYAEAAMRRALDHAVAVHGERPTVLHATEAGRPIYARMGYGTISNHTVFMEKAFLSGH